MVADPVAVMLLMLKLMLCLKPLAWNPDPGTRSPYLYDYDDYIHILIVIIVLLSLYYDVNYVFL